jgi:hypothetical protein
MGEVYKQPLRTLIWLGDADEVTEPAFRLMQLAYDDYLARVDASDGKIRGELSLPEGSDTESFVKFYEKPWFGRVWVVQEAALTPSATCYCGEYEVLWRAVCYAPRRLSSLNLKLDLEWSVESDRGLKAAINGWSLSQAILGNDKAVELTMAMLLDNGRRLGASDDRDKVFGFLGLADWFVLNREGSGFPDSSVLTITNLLRKSSETRRDLPFSRPVSCTY